MLLWKVRNAGMYRKYIKRLLDIMMSAAGIIVLSPVMLVTAFLVRIKLGSPVIFKQKRPGKNEKIFEMYKFRSMTNERDQDGNLLPDEVRLTEFGKTLRATSLDELPELFNILKGDMSVVGPRPQLVRDMVFMTQRQRKRHSVLPGLTGLAQVNGRNNISWEEKLKWDLQYVNHVSFRADILIIIKTIQKVIQKEDISMEGMETAEDLGDYLLRSGKINLSVYEKKIQEEQNIRR
ncbi:bacterial sugar transferase [[Clostridium] symbiosum WAL-14673]|jgi:undecaprenyl phosphate N,N'-diacetylbacillosamine 1-phosphate transferase|nr:bacterial sugar transferase [[Clostridium] symbiosum WAL-14673]